VPTITTTNTTTTTTTTTRAITLDILLGTLFDLRFRRRLIMEVPILLLRIQSTNNPKLEILPMKLLLLNGRITKS